MPVVSFGQVVSLGVVEELSRFDDLEVFNAPCLPFIAVVNPFIFIQRNF